MTDFPWFKTDVQAWVALTDLWTDEQAGAHQRLLCVAWTNGSLPVDPEAIRRIRRWTRAEWSRIWPAIEGQWPVVEGQRINRSLETHRGESQRRIDAARAGGKASARSRGHGSTAVEPPLNDRSTDVEQRFNTGAKRSEAELSEAGERASSLALITARAGVYDLHPAQVRAAAGGLYAAWNNVAAAIAPELKPFEHDPPFSPRVDRALRAHPSIDWWGELFHKVAASDFLRGRVPGRDGRPFVATFWWVLDHCEDIAADAYVNRGPVAVRDANEDAVAQAKAMLR